MSRLLFHLWKFPSYFLIGGVRLYQLTLSPILGKQCRFQPTCSHYFIGAVRKYGAVARLVERNLENLPLPSVLRRRL